MKDKEKLYSKIFHFNCKAYGITVDVDVNEVQLMCGKLQMNQLADRGLCVYEFCVTYNTDDVKGAIRDLFIACPNYKKVYTFERMAHAIRDTWNRPVFTPPKWDRVNTFVNEILADIEEYEKTVE